MIERLRPRWSDEELAVLYARPPVYEWPGHIVRRDVTVSFGQLLWDGILVEPGLGGVASLADLACGDGSIARRIVRSRRAHVILGDVCDRSDLFAVSQDEWFDQGEGMLEKWLTGPIESTVDRIGMVDMVLLSETLEHLDNPGVVLAQLRAHARYMLLTTPSNEQGDNPEHYWRWDAAGVWDLLEDAGWKGQADIFSFDGFAFQIWRCW